MLHEKRFQTACGLFQLDMTMVGTVFGALISYIVILIQFDTSTQETTKPTNVTENKVAAM